jgi:hypothetical protein
MSIDLKTIQAELSEILQCTVSLERADDFVKAYYKPADELIEWARDNLHFSGRQLLGLINCMQLKKKVRE